MASFGEWMSLLWTYFRQLFYRFIWPSPPIEDIDKKAVFITGCDSGFGNATALALNECGFHVFAGCLFPDKEGGRHLRIRATNPKRLHVIQIDVSNDLTVKMAYEEVTKKLLTLPGVTLHAVINNAGICPYGELEWGSIDMIKNVLAVNTIGMVLVTRTFLPLIRASKGRVINVNSVASRFAVPALVPYCMSKYASLAFTEGLRREMTKFEVKVISIEPYFFQTKMTDEEAIIKQIDLLWSKTEPEVRAAYGEHYVKVLTKQSKLIQPFVNKNIDIVVDSIKHGVTAKHPNHHYLCAPLATRIMLYMGWFIWPQETAEFLSEWFLASTKRAKPLPDKAASSSPCKLS